MSVDLLYWEIVCDETTLVLFWLIIFSEANDFQKKYT